MSVLTKRVALVAVLLAFVFAIYSLISSIAVTGSGGLGAVSAGFTEWAIEFLLLFLPFVCVFLYFRHRRRATKQPPAVRT